MSKLYDRCVKCVDSCFINWEKTTLSNREKRTIEEYEVWGMVRLALYILDGNEYNKLKQYIYNTHGYDPGGVTTGQMQIFDVKQ